MCITVYCVTRVCLTGMKPCHFGMRPPLTDLGLPHTDMGPRHIVFGRVLSSFPCWHSTSEAESGGAKPRPSLAGAELGKNLVRALNQFDEKLKGYCVWVGLWRASE